MYIDAERIRGTNELCVWLRDTDGKLIQYQDKLPNYCYVESPVGTHKSIFGHQLARVDFDSFGDMRNYIQKKGRLFESDINAVYKYLSDEFYGIDGGPLNVCPFDIEVYVDLASGKGYPSPDDPFGEVNSISMFDRTQQCYHLFLLRADDVTVESPDGLPVVHHYCDYEATLFKKFFLQIKDIDILTAWNGDGFDIPYLVARITRIMGAKATEHLCRGGFRPDARETKDDFGNEVTQYLLIGRQHIDMLRGYKKFTFEQKSSYKLDNIAEIELGEKKLAYSGNLGELYDTNRQRFYEYSLHDSYLLKRLDEKLRLIDLIITMARQATVRFNDIFGSIRYLEQTIMNYCHHEKETPLILPDKDEDASKESFPGAIVLDTMTGVFGWSMSIDLTSLYPSIIMALGISPETILMQCTERHNDFIRIAERRKESITVILRDDLKREQFDIMADELDDLIREKGYTLSANGTIFTGEEGIIPEVLRGWFRHRKELQAKMKEAAAAGDKEAEKFYDMRQHIQKINLNSLYGALSNPYSRFFDIEMARSITLTGQEIEKYQTHCADMMVRALEGKRA